MKQYRRPLDPLTLDPRAITILIAISRYPNGVTVNKLSSQLAMSYRTLRAICEKLTRTDPPLLLPRDGLYVEYSLLSSARDIKNLDLFAEPNYSFDKPSDDAETMARLADEPSTPIPEPSSLDEDRSGLDSEPTSAPPRAEPNPRPSKRPSRKRTNLTIETCRVARVSLDLLKTQVFLKDIKGIDSLSITNFESTQTKNISYKAEDLRAFKHIRIKNLQIDELIAVPPVGQPAGEVARQTEEVDRKPSARVERVTDLPDREMVSAQQRDSEPSRIEESPTRKYAPLDTRRMVEIELTDVDDIFESFRLIDGRRWKMEDVNPRHNQQYLLHASKLFDNPVLWHPRFNEVPEGVVLGWLAQAKDGAERGKLRQPWGIVYQGLLGKLPNKLPDKPFRDRPHKKLHPDWLTRAGFHLEEEDLPPTPEQDPDWRG